MDYVLHIEDWPAEVLKAAVIDQDELTAEQAAQRRELIHRIGGMENLLLATDLLVELEEGWSGVAIGGA